MKIKFLTIVGLAALASVGGCRSGANTNTAVLNTNTNTVITTMTPMATMTPMMADTATTNTVNAALTKAGITGITVSADTSSITLRGSVAKGKMAQAVRVAQEAGKKPVKNELTEMTK